MLTNIINNLDKIIEEVQTKVIPGNIKAGVQVFGIEGAVEPAVTQVKTIDPSTHTTVITPDEGYNGFHEVFVNPVTNTIDKNIKSSNIKYGTSILGINGILSDITKPESDDMLGLEYDILGYNYYVLKKILHLNNAKYSVDEENGVLFVTGEVNEDGTLIID